MHTQALPTNECVHMHARTHEGMHVCMHTWRNACTHVHTHARMHAHAHAHTHRDTQGTQGDRSETQGEVGLTVHMHHNVSTLMGCMWAHSVQWSRSVCSHTLDPGGSERGRRIGRPPQTSTRTMLNVVLYTRLDCHSQQGQSLVHTALFTGVG